MQAAGYAGLPCGLEGEDLLGVRFRRREARDSGASSRVALVADEYKASWHNMGGSDGSGTAKIIRKGPLFLEIRKRLYKKFKVYESNAGFEEGEPQSSRLRKAAV